MKSPAWFIGLILLFSAMTTQAAAAPRVSLLLGDIATRQTADIVREVSASQPALAGARIKVYASTRIKEQDLEHLRHSDLVIIHIVARPFVTSIKEELAQTLRNGGQVYAFGNGYNDEDAALGIRTDAELKRYFESGGEANIRNGLLYAFTKLGIALPFAPPEEVPETAIYDFHRKTFHGDFSAFAEGYAEHRPGRPWIGFVVYRSNIVAGTTSHYEAVVDALERRGFNVLPAFGYPPEKSFERFFFDERGNTRVDAVVAASVKMGVAPDIMLPLLNRLGVPVINAISLRAPASHAEWIDSRVGMDIMERSWQLALAEMAGEIQPTVFAVKETVRDSASGIEYIEERPVPERVEMLARRVERWVALRHKPNHQKRILLHYFNFPPGKEGIGASYLNVAPESLWTVMQRMATDGYKLTGMPVEPQSLRKVLVDYGTNIPNWNHDQIDQLARSGKAVLLPIEKYKEWFAELPRPMQEAINAKWGRPEVNTMMAYTDDNGRRFFVLPGVRYGNVLLAPQPSGGWSENAEHLYHDTTMPPSHQYVAFYLWLHKEYKPDAMVQFGTHGNLEWLPTKEAGLNIDDWPEFLTQDLPNIYAYIMDNPGEGTQAKRRGLGVMVSHLTPPFDQATLNPELRELQSRISDYQTAQQKNPQLAETRLEGIVELAARIGILKDLGLTPEQMKNPPPELVEELHEYLEEISDKPTPFGLHTLGKAPAEKFIQSTAEAIAAFDTTPGDARRKDRIEELKALIRLSPQQELDSIMKGLSGRFIDAGVGGDPLRRPNALPTGRNFYSFDPRLIPADSTYKTGVKLASELIETYKAKHGEYPDKLTFNVWGVETMRHEGVTEAQIMYLLGVRPVWDTRGAVVGVEAIPRAELGRPRIDVTMIPSGEYRDLFGNVMALLDKAVSVAQAQDEPDNAVRNNSAQTRAMLEQRGIKAELAARLAAVRLFSMPSGAYGTNLNYVSERSDTWDSEQQVVDVYFMRMSHMYGQGFWGDNGDESVQPGIGKDLLRNALSGTKIAVHSRSSNVYQTLDTDDVFQYLGGTAMAIRAVDGTSPEVYVSNLSNPAQVTQETLDKMMGREMRTRYLNPEWIKAMQKEGYAGARFMNKVVQNLWGWQVTVPEAVDAAKWNEMYATYVQDRYQLDMEQFFRDSGNLWAYQALMSRMLEAVRKGYWKPDDAVVEDLGQKVSDLIEELQLKCTEEDCHDPILTKLVQAKLVPVPAAVAVAQTVPAPPSSGSQAQATGTPAPAAAAQQTQAQPVQGYEMKEVTRRITTPMEPLTPWLQILGFLLFSTVLWWGFRRAYRWAYRI